MIEIKERIIHTKDGKVICRYYGYAIKDTKLIMPHGQYIKYNLDGSISYITNYKHGLLHGKYEIFGKNNKLLSVQFHKNKDMMYFGECMDYYNRDTKGQLNRFLS